jgi:hypothetical protein
VTNVTSGTVVVLGADLMDRSRIAAAFPDAQHVRTPGECAGAGTVVIDLARASVLVTAVRAAAPTAWIVGYGPHADSARLDAARRQGCDRVVPRSVFFHNPAVALETPTPPGLRTKPPRGAE